MIAKGNGDDAGLVAIGPGEVLDPGRVGQVEGRGHAGGFGIAGILEQILHRAALHAGLGPPRADGIDIAFVVAVVLGVGVEEHADRSALLGQVDLHAAKVGAITANHNLAVQVDVPRRQLIEVLEPPVIRVHHFARDVSRTRGAVERHHHARIVLAGVALHVFARRTAHEQMAGLVIGLDADDFGPIQQHAVGNDRGLEPSGAKLLRHILRGLAVFRRGRKVRLGCERLQLLAGQFGIGHGQELFLELALRR